MKTRCGSTVLISILMLFTASVTCDAQSSKITAGNFQTIYLPTDHARLQGAINDVKNISKFQWRKIAGPSEVKFGSAGNSSTTVTNLRAGEYRFELSATLSNKSIMRDTSVLVVYSTADVKVPSANNYPNLLGSNPGYYGAGWNDRQVYTMMAKAGCGSTRSTIPMFFFKYYGDSIRYPEFKYFYDTLGFRENVYFLYNLAGTDYPDQSDETFNGERAVVPKGMYLPIWNSDGSVNINNTFAYYCFKSATVYGKFFRYFEVWNEPDFTGNWAAAGALPGTPGNWWESDPKSTDLYNLKAPAQYYVRMLRIAYEVIKRYQPDAIITLGGVGFPSFLHFILRSTDNPVADKSGKRGAKTPEYPFTGGAYFDGLSFHSYPQFYLKFWDFTTGSMGYKRNSDEAIDQTIRDKQKFEKLLWQFGYDGKRLPAKPFICTEINIPRKQIQQDIGGIEVQKNFAWKTIAQFAKNGINQVYWFVTAETADYENSNDGYKLMGLIKNVLRTRPGREELTEEGVANKSAQLLLDNFFYDEALTRQLKLPPNIEGGAWKNPKTGEVRFMLWAKTGQDLDENSVGYYSMPEKFQDKKLEVYKPDYAISKKAASVIEPIGMKLNGEPVVLIVSKQNAEKRIALSAVMNRKPFVSAGRDTIIHQQFLMVRGNVGTNLESNAATNFYWDLVKVPANQGDYPALKNKFTLSPVIMGLQKGVYGLRLTASNNFGIFSSDTVWIAVDTLVSFPDIHAQAKPFQEESFSTARAILQNEPIVLSNLLVRNRKSKLWNIPKGELSR